MSARTRWMTVMFIGYPLSWLFAYVLVMGTMGDGLDLNHVFEYLVLAWTFSGGELPSFIWFGSLVIFAALIVVIALASNYYGKARERAV
jgi:hypothetical protein